MLRQGHHPLDVLADPGPVGLDPFGPAGGVRRQPVLAALPLFPGGDRHGLRKHHAEFLVGLPKVQHHDHWRLEAPLAGKQAQPAAEAAVVDPAHDHPVPHAGGGHQACHARIAFQRHRRRGAQLGKRPHHASPAADLGRRGAADRRQAHQVREEDLRDRPGRSIINRTAHADRAAVRRRLQRDRRRDGAAGRVAAEPVPVDRNRVGGLRDLGGLRAPRENSRYRARPFAGLRQIDQASRRGRGVEDRSGARVGKPQEDAGVLVQHDVQSVERRLDGRRHRSARSAAGQQHGQGRQRQQGPSETCASVHGSARFPLGLLL